MNSDDDDYGVGGSITPGRGVTADHGDRVARARRRRPVAPVRAAIDGSVHRTGRGGVVGIPIRFDGSDGEAGFAGSDEVSDVSSAALSDDSETSSRTSDSSVDDRLHGHRPRHSSAWLHRAARWQSRSARFCRRSCRQCNGIPTCIAWLLLLCVALSLAVTFRNTRVPTSPAFQPTVKHLWRPLQPYVEGVLGMTGSSSGTDADADDDDDAYSAGNDDDYVAVPAGMSLPELTSADERWGVPTPVPETLPLDDAHFGDPLSPESAGLCQRTRELARSPRARSSPCLPPMQWPLSITDAGRAFGVPELVTVPPSFQDNSFVPDKSYTTASEDDAAVLELYGVLRGLGDPRLRVAGAHLTGLSTWGTTHERVAESVELWLSVLRGPKADIYARYRHYDVRDAPVHTPECLAFLAPEWNRRPHLAAYRKCCVEHRRLRDLLHWTLRGLRFAREGVALSKGAVFGGGTPFRHFVSSAALIGAVRDGGALPCSSVGDVEVMVVPGDEERLYTALQEFVLVDESTSAVVSRTGLLREGASRVTVPSASPSGGWFERGDVTVELRYRRPELSRGGWWPDVVDPIATCAMYNEAVPCPSDAAAWLDRALGSGWREGRGTPPVYGLFGLHYCGLNEPCRL